MYAKKRKAVPDTDSKAPAAKKAYSNPKRIEGEGCRALSDDEVNMILIKSFPKSSFWHRRDKAMFLFALRTGFRVAEVASVRLSEVCIVADIDDPTSAIMIRQKVIIPKERMKGKKRPREVAIKHEDLKAALLEYIAWLRTRPHVPVMGTLYKGRNKDTDAAKVRITNCKGRQLPAVSMADALFRSEHAGTRVHCKWPQEQRDRLAARLQAKGMQLKKLASVLPADAAVLADAKNGEKKVKNSSGGTLREMPCALLADCAVVCADAAPDEKLAYNSGKQISPSTLYVRFRSWLKLAGVKPERDGELGFHCLRKTFAIRYYEANDRDIASTSAALGHKSIAVTQLYLKIQQMAIDEGIGNMR